MLRGVVYMMKRVDQGQSLGGHRRRMCARKTGQLHIIHCVSEKNVILPLFLVRQSKMN